MNNSEAIGSKVATTVEANDVVAFVENVREMGGRDPGHAAGKIAIFEKDNRLAGLAKAIGDRKTCNAAADDADIRPHVLLERSKGRHPGGRGPDGLASHDRAIAGPMARGDKPCACPRIVSPFLQHGDRGDA